VYLQHHTTWSLKDFRLLEETVFEHFDELKKKWTGECFKTAENIEEGTQSPKGEKKKEKPHLGSESALIPFGFILYNGSGSFPIKPLAGAQ